MYKPFRINSLPLNRYLFFVGLILAKLLLLRSFVFPQSLNLRITLLELAPLIFIFGMIELINPRSAKIFWCIDFLVSFFFVAFVLYYNHFGFILGFQVFSEAVMLKGVGSSIIALFSPVYLLFFLDIFLLPIIWVRGKYRKKRVPVHDKTRRVPVALTCLLALLFSATSVVRYPEKDNMMALAKDTGVLNAEFWGVYRSFQPVRNTLPTGKLSQAAINQLEEAESVPWPKFYGTAAGKNIILIQLESTQNFVVGLSLNGQEITPNLNKLREDSLYFPHFYSQIGPGNTSDAEFAVNTSIYPLASESVAIRYKQTSFPSLPHLLKTKGYTAVTFHPNAVTYWNRDTLYPNLGFDRYFDKSFYHDEDLVGRWGSSDEVLFQKAIPVLVDYKNHNQKFYASFITLTNHHPYKLPANKKSLTLPAGMDGTLLGDYLTSVHYEDYALGLFIQALKANHLWDDTVLIIYGDHFGIPEAEEKKSQSTLKKILGREYTVIDRLNVPLFLRVPELKPQTVASAGGQVDILPTLANLFKLSLNGQLVFGRDILNTKHNLLGFRYYYPEGTYISSGVFHRGGTGNSTPEEQKVKTLLQLSDSYLQSLSP
jgi:lipoteichoic acid synthase